MIELAGKVMASDRQIIIESEHSRFSTGLIESKYPDWQRVTPRDFTGTAAFDADDFLSAIKTVQLGGEQAKMIFSDGQVLIQNANAEAVCECQIDAEVEAAFNLQYVADAIQAAGKAEITMQIGSGARGSSLINGRFIVMPVRF